MGEFFMSASQGYATKSILLEKLEETLNLISVFMKGNKKAAFLLFLFCTLYTK